MQPDLYIKRRSELAQVGSLLVPATPSGRFPQRAHPTSLSVRGLGRTLQRFLPGRLILRYYRQSLSAPRAHAITRPSFTRPACASVCRGMPPVLLSDEGQLTPLVDPETST